MKDRKYMTVMEDIKDIKRLNTLRILNIKTQKFVG